MRPVIPIAAIFDEMVKHGKPDPSLFRSCLTQLQVADASCTIAIGDTPYDAEAAGQLGMRSVGVFTGVFPEGTLREAGYEGVFPEVKDVAALWQNGQTRLR